MNTQYDLLETLADFRLTAEIVELSQISLPKELPVDLKETLLQPSTKQTLKTYVNLFQPLVVSVSTTVP
jgi:hypothetical protein